MNKYKILFLFFIVITILLTTKSVFALQIEEPRISSIEYIGDTSVKINYVANNTNSNYKIQIYNMTNGKYYSDSITNGNYVISELETGKTYNIIIRAYYSTFVSEWSNATSVTPKYAIPTITGLTEGDSSVVLSYNTNGSPKNVEIYNTVTKKSVKSNNLEATTITGLTNGTTYTFLMRNCYSDGKCGGWSLLKSGTPKESPISCSLKYNTTSDELTFNTTKGATNYAIVKSGKTPSYKTSKPTYYPGSDGTGSKTYIGYVKNTSGKTATCTLKVSVSRGAAVVAYGKKFLGKKYCDYKHGKKYWNGGSTWKCTDCSGFTSGVYKHFGKSLGGSPASQCSTSKTYKVSGKNSTKGAEVGDIVCYWGARRYGRPNGWKHVALYIGNGKMLENTTAGSPDSVKISKMRSGWKSIVRVK